MKIPKELDDKLPVDCPKCNKKFIKFASWLIANSNLTCTCGNIITIDRNGLKAQVQKALAKHNEIISKSTDLFKK